MLTAPSDRPAATLPIGTLALIISIGVALYAVIARDGRHHWHEYRHVFSAVQYTNRELMAGAFDPGPSPVATPAAIADWYAPKLLHVSFLRAVLSGARGNSRHRLVTWLYGLLIPLSATTVAVTVAITGFGYIRSLVVFNLLLLNPLSLYLGFKLMPEVLAFFLLCACLSLLLLAARRTSDWLQWVAAIASAILMGLALLADWKAPLVVVTLGVALLLASDTRRYIPIHTPLVVSCLATTVTTWLLVGSLLGVTPSVYLRSALHSLSFSKDLPMWAFAGFNLAACTFSVAPLVAFAMMGTNRLRTVALTWLLLTIILLSASSWNFLEPRHLTGMIIPLATLGVLGFDELTTRVRLRGLFAVVLLVGFATAGGLIQPLMPFELDENAFEDALSRASSGPPLLVPWNYSDYHYLWFRHPEVVAYLVQSSHTVDGYPVSDPAWDARRRSAYGEHFLASDGELGALGATEYLYLGWTVLPSLENIHRLADATGVQRLRELLDPRGFLDHEQQSWLWNNPRYDFTREGQFGQYRLFRVHRREQGL